MRSNVGFHIIAINKETGETIQTHCTTYKNRESLRKRLNKSEKIQLKVLEPIKGLGWADFSRNLL